MSVKIDVHCHLLQADAVERESFLRAWLGLNDVPNYVVKWVADIVLSGALNSVHTLTLLLRPWVGDEAHNLACQLKNAGGQFWPTFSLPHQAMVPVLLSAYEEEKVDLFVPLMTDYEEWLEGDPKWFVWRPNPATGHAECRVEWKKQVIAQSGGRIHLFAPFCPLRAAAHDIETEVAKVVRLVESDGFIGVKLYPLMGYYPCGNAARSKDEWLPPRHRAYGATYARIDLALDKLYAACAAAEIPITAHCSPQGSRGPHGASKNDHSVKNQAHPLNWADVLAKYPNLRLNLAHMAGDHFQTLSKKELNTEADWAFQIAQLMDAHPFVYADRSIQLPPPRKDAKKRARYAKRLFHILGLHPTVPKRMMNGSDWHLALMYGEEDEWREANARFREILATHPNPHLADWFFGENAADFLGLRSGGANRARLERYYRDTLHLAEADFPAWWSKV